MNLRFCNQIHWLKLEADDFYICEFERIFNPEVPIKQHKIPTLTLALSSTFKRGKQKIHISYYLILKHFHSIKNHHSAKIN